MPSDIYFDATQLDHHDPLAVADTFELQLLASRDPYLSISEYRDLFSAGSEPSAAEIESGITHVETRKSRMGRYYPFSTDGQGVAFDESNHWELYGFLLIATLRGTPFREEHDWKRSDPSFDQIVREAFAGKYAHTLWFGWPPREARPPTFPEALLWAATEMGLQLRGPELALPTHRQDGGVDVIAWDPYRDGNDGFPVVLVQNTLQQAFSGKPADVDPYQWRDWINFGNTPSVGFAVPFEVSNTDPLRPQVVSRVHDFMDRTRLMEKIETRSPEDTDWWEGVVTFVQEQLDHITERASHGTVRLSPQKKRKRTPRQPRLD